MILLDTSYLVALFSSSDSQHARAVKIRSELQGKILGVSEYVVLELTTVLASRLDIATARLAVSQLLEAQEVRFIPCSPIFSASLQKMFVQTKYALSFVDCSFLVLLESGEADELITFDRKLASRLEGVHEKRVRYA